MGPGRDYAVAKGEFKLIVKFGRMKEAKEASMQVAQDGARMYKAFTGD